MCGNILLRNRFRTGYGSFWYTADNTMETRTAGIFFNLGEAHNGYLDILLQLGAVGIIAVVVMTAGVLLSISRLPNWGSAGLLKLVAVYLTVTFYLTNVTESTLMRVGMDSWVFFVLAIAATARFAPHNTSTPRARACH